MQRLQNIRPMASPRKRKIHLFPPIEMNNKASNHLATRALLPAILDSPRADTPTPGALSATDLLTSTRSFGPRSIETLAPATFATADLLPPTRTYRPRAIGTPPPPKTSRESPNNKNYSVDDVYPHIVVQEDTTEHEYLSESSGCKRSLTSQSPMGPRKRLIPPHRLMKLKSEDVLQETTDWRIPEKELLSSSMEGDVIAQELKHRLNSKTKGPLKLLPLKGIPVAQVTADEGTNQIKSQFHPFAPD